MCVLFSGAAATAAPVAFQMPSVEGCDAWVYLVFVLLALLYPSPVRSVMNGWRKNHPRNGDE